MDEFVEKEKPSQTQQSLQPLEKGKAREADDTDPFIPTYLYDAMKEKKLFKNMLVPSPWYVPVPTIRHSITDLCCCIVYRTAGSRMPENSSVST